MRWLLELRQAWRNPPDTSKDDFDYDFPDGIGFINGIPPDEDCPDTQPTSPGLLDTDTERQHGF